GRAGGELEVLGRFGQFERGQDGLLPAGDGGALRDLPVGCGQGDQVHAVEFVAQVAPGVAGGGFGDAEQQQREPAQLHVGADAVLAVVVDGTKPQGALAVSPAAFDGDELLVGGGQIGGGQCQVGGAQQPFSVEVGLACGGAAVDAEQPGLGAAQVAAQPRLVAQRPDQFVAFVRGPGIGAGDQPVEVFDQPVAHGGVAVGGIGVVAD